MMVSTEMVSTQVAHAFSVMDALWILCVLCAVYLIGRAVCQAWGNINESLKEKKEIAAQGEEDIFPPADTKLGASIITNPLGSQVAPDFGYSDFDSSDYSDCEL
jgi:hypothetical protein